VSPLFFPGEGGAADSLAGLGIDLDASYMRMLSELAPATFRALLWGELMAGLTTRPSPHAIPLALVLPAAVDPRRAFRARR
jgi:hypothetical protein